MVYDTLVLSSGGTKGFAELGALSVLDLFGWLDDITHCVGVSVGAVISFLLCCGYRPIEIFLGDNNFIRFLVEGIKLGFVKQTWTIVDPKNIKQLLRKMLHQKAGMHSISMGALSKVRGMRLTVVSYILKGEKSSVAFHDSVDTPDMDAVDAVVASCAIPLIIGQVTINNEIHVDGGLACPFPLKKYDDGKKGVVGIYVESINDTSTTLGYLSACLDAHKRANLESQKPFSGRCTLIEIPCKDVGYVIDDAQYASEKKRLFLEGFSAANKLFATR